MKVDLALLERIHENILREATGSPDRLAEKLGISKRYLYLNIEYLKTKFEAPIVYSRSRETFYYTEEWEFYVGNLIRVKGELIKNVLATFGKHTRIVIFFYVLGIDFSVLCTEGIKFFT